MPYKAERRSRSLTRFIRENRAELDQVILKKVPSSRLNDEERRQWVLNDEGLYNAARAWGWRG
jgi:hypothetical protein